MRYKSSSILDVDLPRLGFGCASLMARINMAESLRVLEVAYDEGVTHFDVARSYGYGEAEKAVGAFITDKRNEVTITTKLGILPPQKSAGLNVAKAAARKVVQYLPGLRSMLRRRAGQMVRGGNFSVETARQSLETSLRELGTDYVDVLLLHECQYVDLTDDLLEFLKSAVSSGAVRSFGIAATPEATSEILAKLPHFAPVAQLASCALHDPRVKIPHEGHTYITHSVFSDPVNEHLNQAHLSLPKAVTKSSEILGEDFRQPGVVKRFILTRALYQNADGTVLFSSLDRSHIRHNIAVLRDNIWTPEQVAAVTKILSDVEKPGASPFG